MLEIQRLVKSVLPPRGCVWKNGNVSVTMKGKNIIINNNYVASAETQVKSFPQSSTIQSNRNFHTSAANWRRGNSGNSSVWCETSEVFYFMVAVLTAASHLKDPPAWHGRKIDSTLQFRPPAHAGPQIPERHPAKLWVNWWLEHAGKWGKEAGGESSCNLSTLEACVAAVRWVWCKVFPKRGLPWCRHSVKRAALHLKP